MDEFVVITDRNIIEILLIKEDFLSNSHIIDSLPLILQYGNNSYLIRKQWLKENTNDIL